MDNVVFQKFDDKKEVFKMVEQYLSTEFSIHSFDDERPWGGFFVIQEADAELFIKKFFPELEIERLRIAGKLSPKILLVQPGKKLSWQYHHRRAEVWKLINGEAGVVRSDDDHEKDLLFLEPGKSIRLKTRERHRLVGLNNWGMIAEIWQHTDADHPSDEDDIVRVQDDFGR
ncbi:MAG: phosphoheptose isomerase [Chitinophagaceae bacterium]|nr:MAG: phosphoheptose isomerase [Chitinophagaceae bacterium]